MHPILIHIKSWLLVACILADCAGPLILPDKFARESFATETQKEEDTSGKKEGKTDSEKIFSQKQEFRFLDSALASGRNFSSPATAASQCFLPVITPPPKAFA
ncbi:MAG: hypothetical protein IPH04_06945 [Saprospirales bacterium]|nr:hypothetical protein [Saprospirales bacterium]